MSKVLSAAASGKKYYYWQRESIEASVRAASLR